MESEDRISFMEKERGLMRKQLRRTILSEIKKEAVIEVHNAGILKKTLRIEEDDIPFAGFAMRTCV